jgi:hypothetical protein
MKKLISAINAATVDQKIELETSDHFFKWVEFEYDKYEDEFCWTAERSWKNTERVGYVFPSKSSNIVKSFKTLKGAKRNFIKSYMVEHCFLKK